jgi:hypothetical protein
MTVEAEMALGFSHLGFAIIYGCTVFFVPTTLYGREQLTFRQRYLIFMNMSSISSVLEGMVGLFTLASCFLYIAETYDEDYNSISGEDCTDSAYFLAEVVLSTGFAFHFVLYLYLAPNMAKYMFSLQTLVDVLTIVPMYLTVFAPYRICNFMDSSLKFVRVVRLLRVLRSLTLIASGAQNPIVFQLVVTVATMVVTLVFAAGIVHFLQNLGEDVEHRETWNGDKRLTFIDALYFIVITFSSVGYGDFSPVTGLGEIVTIVLILFTIYIVPSEASRLSFLMNMQSKFLKPYEPQGAYTHVVIACNVTCRGIQTFLSELYHDDHVVHGSKLLKVVVLAPDEPDAFMNEILLKHSPGNRLHFIKGDARIHDDLRKAKVGAAAACFILSDREAEDSNQEDAVSVLRAMSMKTFDMNTTLYVQIIEPENKRYLVQAGIDRNHIVCINELEMKLTAQTCLCTGFAAFLTNLVSSSTFPTHDLARPWHKEYWSGLSNEIYRLALSSRFDGLTFDACAKEIYHQNHALLFAVKPLMGESVLLFPGSEYTLKSGDIGFLIAEHFKIVETLGEEGPEPMESILGKTESRVHSLGGTCLDMLESVTSMVVKPASNTISHKRRLSHRIKVAKYSLANLTEQKPPLRRQTTHLRKILLGQSPSSKSDRAESSRIVDDGGDSEDDKDGRLRQVTMMKSPGPDRCSQLQKAVLEVWKDLYCAQNEGHLEDIDQRASSGEDDGESTHLKRRVNNEDFLRDLSAITARFSQGKARFLFSASEITSLLKSMAPSSATDDEVDTIEDHILVITPNLADVRHFLLPLRCLHTVDARSVVILTPRTEQNNHEMQRIKTFANVFCIFGDRRLREDLEKAGIARAFCVVVLAERRKSMGRTVEPDADVILTAKDIAMLAIGSNFQRMIVQLHDHNYIQHLPSSHLQSARSAAKAQDLDEMLYGYHFRGDYHFQPSFAAGRVVLSSFAELLMAQCFYNPEIVQIVRTLAGGGMQGGDDDEMDVDSEVLTQESPSTFQHRPSKTFLHPKEEKHPGCGRSYPAQMNLPPDFAGKKTFGDLVSVLLEEDIMPLALYRKAKLTRGIEISFIYTNPPPDEKLQQGDSVFAIVHGLPNERTSQD